MPLDFPATPSVGQAYNGYVWSGTAWEAANPNTISLTGQVIVADAAARNALYPSPVQGNAVFRNDLGYEETYYGLYNVTTNPGGRAVAGWYPNPSAGMAGQPLAVASGIASLTISGSNQGFVAITFPSGRFASAPTVTTNINSGSGVTQKLNSRAINITASGCNIYNYTGDGSATTSTHNVSYIAVEM